MDEKQFWNLIDQSRGKSADNLDSQMETLRTLLGKLSKSEIAEFQRNFDLLFFKAYTWKLWGAAFVIYGGCSDDVFAAFRAGLIARGKKIFDEALKNPESLVSINPPVDDCEELLLLAGSIYQEKAGKELETGTEHPDEPLGEPFDEESVFEEYPKLAKMFG